MTSRIESAFKAAAESGRRAFIPYLTGGFPDADACRALLTTLDQCGADIIEVGIPFSDPLADGPVIQQASKQALSNGTTPASVLDLVAQVRPAISGALVIMSYWNPILRMGAREFAARASDAGVDGVIVPDLPPEEAKEWVDAAGGRALDTIFMVAPTTPAPRRKMIAEMCRGFLYYVSLTGVTGSDVAVSPALLDDVRSLKAVSSVPVAVGFGVSGPKEAGPLSTVADGVIVGTAIIREILRHPDLAAQTAATARMAESIIGALNVVDHEEDRSARFVAMENGQ